MKHDNSSRFIELGTDPENKHQYQELKRLPSLAVLNFVIVGRDTTATTLSWAIYMIMSNDHVAEKLYAKLKALEKERAEEENVSLKPCETQDPESFDLRTKQFADLMTYDSLGKLYYLHVVITETRRLYPAITEDSGPYKGMSTFVHSRNTNGRREMAVSKVAPFTLALAFEHGRSEIIDHREIQMYAALHVVVCCSI
ncbi:cytochrome P450 704B1 [Tanacetum coccineum]